MFNSRIYTLLRMKMSSLFLFLNITSNFDILPSRYRTPPFRRRGLLRVLRRRYPLPRLRRRRPPRGSVQSRVDRLHAVRQDIHTLLPLRGAQEVPPEAEAASVPLSDVRQGKFSATLTIPHKYSSSRCRAEHWPESLHMYVAKYITLLFTHGI